MLRTAFRELKPGAPRHLRPQTRGGPSLQGRCSYGRMHFPAASCPQLLCQYSNAFSRVIGSISFGLFSLSPMYNGKGFKHKSAAHLTLVPNIKSELSVTIL